jgi:hypothetical protein
MVPAHARRIIEIILLALRAMHNVLFGGISVMTYLFRFTFTARARLPTPDNLFVDHVKPVYYDNIWVYRDIRRMNRNARRYFKKPSGRAKRTENPQPERPIKA